MFNWVVQTRSTIDIQKRCDYLITQFKKELYPNEELLKVKVKQIEPDKEEEAQAEKEAQAEAEANEEESEEEDEEDDEEAEDNEESYNPG